jgi:hypothetical protein
MDPLSHSSIRTDYMPPECVAAKQEGSPQSKGWIERILDWIFGTTHTTYSYVKLGTQLVGAGQSQPALVVVIKKIERLQMGIFSASFHVTADHRPQHTNYASIDFDQLDERFHEAIFKLVLYNNRA